MSIFRIQSLANQGVENTQRKPSVMAAAMPNPCCNVRNSSTPAGVSILARMDRSGTVRIHVGLDPICCFAAVAVRDVNLIEVVGGLRDCRVRCYGCMSTDRMSILGQVI